MSETLTQIKSRTDAGKLIRIGDSSARALVEEKPITGDGTITFRGVLARNNELPFLPGMNRMSALVAILGSNLTEEQVQMLRKNGLKSMVACRLDKVIEGQPKQIFAGLIRINNSQEL